ncbi:unnamed protein product [Diplocarpon coronariae]
MGMGKDMAAAQGWERTSESQFRAHDGGLPRSRTYMTYMQQLDRAGQA